MTKIAPPAPPYVGPAKHTMGSNNKPIYRVVIHATVGSEPGVRGAARGVASMFRSTDRYASAHYVADASESVQVVYDSLIAEHAPPNQHSIGYELCCSLSGEGKGHWDKADHQAMLKRVADDVAHLCLAYDVPIVKLSSGQLRAGQHGICGHVDVSNAWHQTTHWDPGPYFPWDQFIGMVKAAADKLLNPDPTPTPPPAPKPPPKHHPHKHARRVGTLNIQSVPLMSLDRVRGDVQHASGEAGVLLFQEIQPPGYKAAVRALTAGGKWEAVQLDHTECPIVFRSHVWKRLDDGEILTHHGKPKVSPDRRVTWAVLEQISNGAVVCFVNTHYVSAAWSTRSVLSRPWRKKMWRKHFEEQSALVTSLVDKGYTVVFGEDANQSQKRMPKYHPKQVNITTDGIDHLGYIEGKSAKVTVVNHDRVGAFASDHDMQRVRLRFEPFTSA